MITLNTNLGSMIVQSNLTASTNALNAAIERMTTGFKINHAKDNAANYSISTNLASKLSSYSVAQDNVAMGLDMLTTAEDSLSLISDHLSRIRDLTEQAANGTYGQDSLNAIQSEITARLAECDRIVSNTEYNGIKLFDEGASSTTGGGEFIQQIDPLTEEEALAQGYTIIKTADELQAINNNLSGKYILMSDIDLAGYNWDPIGDANAGTFFSGEFNGNGHVIRNLIINKPGDQGVGLFSMSAGTIENVGLENVDVTGNLGVGGLAGFAGGNINNCYVMGSISSALGSAGGLVGIYYSGDMTNCYSDIYIEVENTDPQYYFGAGGLVSAYFNGNLVNCYSQGTISGGCSIGGLIAGIGMQSGDNVNITNSSSTCKILKDTNSIFSGGLIGFYVSGSSSTIVNTHYYNSVNPGMAVIGDNNTQGVDLSGITDGGTPPASLMPLYKPNFDGGVPDTAKDTSINFQAGIHSDSSSQINLDLSFGYSGLSIDVSTSDAARNSLNQIDEMLSKIRSKQTEYGAAYNRLESALESIGVSIDNLTSTQSTIRDADIAEVSSEYIQMQILQQASATLLATANQTPSIALQLL